MTKVAVYTRLSLDRTGFQTATARQAEACAAMAAARGWDIAEIFEDVDVSAYQRKIVRPAFRALCEGISEGAFDGVLVWKLDRLVRRPSEFERVWEICEAGSVFLASVTEPLDSSTDLGLALIRILVTFASLESATTSLRMRTRNRHAAFAGQAPHGRRGYGLDRAREAFVPEEADRVREAATRILSGDSPDEIVRDWNRRGVPGADGGRWRDTTLLDIMRSARIAGNRSYHGEVAAVGCMPAILDPVTAARLSALLADRHRRKLFVTRHHLLARLVRCGRCGSLLTWSGSRPTYTCGKVTGCRGISITAPNLENHVEKQLLRRTGAGALGRQPMEPKETLALLDAVRAGFQAIPYAVEPEARRDVEHQRQVLFEDYRRTESLDEVPFHGRQLARAWPRLSTDERRSQVERYVRSITVAAAPTRGSTFRPDRVHIEWW
jgi:DNA invertase Pin-like site-specific DNA recombinase